MILIICAIIFVSVLFTYVKKGTDVFSPARLFILVWAAAIGLKELRFSKYQQNWTDYSWTMLFIPLFSMLIGMFIVYVIYLDKPICSISYMRQKVKEQYLNKDMLFKYSVALLVLYFISYTVSYLAIGYVPLFTLTPDIVRTTWGVFGFGLLIQSIPAILFLIALYITLVKNELYKKIFLLFAGVFALITYFFLLQRYYILMPIIIAAVFLYYVTKKLRARNVFFLLIAMSGIMYGISSIRVSRYALNFLYYLSRMKFNVKYAFFTEPYMYVVMNLENFGNAVKKLTKFSYGSQSVDFLFALTGLKYPLKEYLALPDYPNLITNSYNTYTMFFVYYQDFGIIGLALVPFFIGALFEFAYYRMRTKPDINSISVYALFVFVILFSFFVPIITYLHYIFNLSLVYFITKMCITRTEPEPALA